MADIIDAKLDLLTNAILVGTKFAREAMSDLLKFAFNLLHHYPKVRSKPAFTMVRLTDLQLLESECEAADDKDAKIVGDFWGSRLDGSVPLTFLDKNLIESLCIEYCHRYSVPSVYCPHHSPVQ